MYPNFDPNLDWIVPCGKVVTNPDFNTDVVSFVDDIISPTVPPPTYFSCTSLAWSAVLFLLLDGMDFVLK